MIYKIKTFLNLKSLELLFQNFRKKNKKSFWGRKFFQKT